jgi:BirA family biotin operon repressor/biotin-[acetyl-CoA-carboxylase] ligase
VIAWRLESHATLASTSDEAVRRAKAGEAAGLAILALRQSAGRGSRGRSWTAPAGNLNLSILLRPARAMAEAGLFSLICGIAVAEALEGLGARDLRLKWPNDVLLGEAKLAGILIDASAKQDRLEWLVAGIGVNLRAAPEIPGRATAALAAQGLVIPPETAAWAVLDRLALWLEAAPAQIRAAWLARGPAPGAPLQLARGAEVLRGRFAGLSEAGELLLRREDRIEAVNTGEILLGGA